MTKVMGLGGRESNPHIYGVCLVNGNASLYSPGGYSLDFCLFSMKTFARHSLETIFSKECWLMTKNTCHRLFPFFLRSAVNLNPSDA